MIGTSATLWDPLGDAADSDVTVTEARTGEPVWILSVVIAGQVWRWASEQVEITTDAGRTLRIVGGLSIAPEEGADLLNIEAPELSISAEGLIPHEDVSALIEAGHVIDDVPAEVALWYEGRTWEQRMVLLRGSTWLPSYGTVDDEIALTVEAPDYEDQGRLLEPNGVVSAVTLPGTKPGDKVDGRVYPLVIGRPDWVPATIYDTITARAVVCTGQADATALAISQLDVNATTIVLHVSSLSTRRDSFGKWVTTSDYGVSITNPDEVVSHWNDENTAGGGIISDHGSGYITGLGDVVRWAMRRSTIPIDEGRWRACEDRLNRYLIDFWTNDLELTPWRFVQEDLLPLVPVSILRNSRGLYPVWWPYDSKGGAEDRVAEVGVQQSGLQRAGLVEYDRRDRPVNEISLEYYPWQGDLWRYRLTYTGRDVGADETSDTFLVPTSPLRAAFARHRGVLRAAPLIQSRAIYQRATAEMVLNWKQFAMSRSPRMVTYDDTRGVWAWLRTGSVVQLVDDELGIERLAWVRRRQWSAGAVRLSFTLWDHT